MGISPLVFRSLPKPDLHSHIDGSIPARELFLIARRHRRKVLTRDGAELETASAFARFFEGSGYGTMLENIVDRFYPITGLLQTEAALKDAGVAYVKAQKEEGVAYAEGRFAPQYHADEGLSLDDVIASMAEGLAEGSERYGVKTGLIVAIGRHSSPKVGEEVARSACRSKSVVGLDLGGPEAGNPPQRFRAAFKLATAAGLKKTIHAGEDAGSVAKDMAYMRAAIAMGADRIGHAIHLAESERLVSAVRDRGIVVEMNPISNMVLGKISTPRDLAIDSLLQTGVRVTLNSDDPALWRNGGLCDVYGAVSGAYGFSMREVDILVENGFRGAFASDRVKESLIGEYRSARRRLP
jgi:adenosine deaminase